MSCTYYYQLETRKKEDFQQVKEFAEKVAKEHTLKDTGDEWDILYSDEELSQEREDRWCMVSDDCICWEDHSYYTDNLDADKLVTRIASEFPDLEFIYTVYPDAGESESFIWDGTKWQEASHLVLGVVCQEKSYSTMRWWLREHAACLDSALRLTEFNSEKSFVRCQFALEQKPIGEKRIDAFLAQLAKRLSLNNDDVQLKCVVAEFDPNGDIMFKKGVYKENSINWTVWGETDMYPENDEDDRTTLDAESVNRLMK